MGTRGAARAALLLFFSFAGILLLFFFDPATTPFYPPCLFKTVLGAQCPGCGSLRAAHQLLHGNFAAAWALNRPLLIALPLAAAISLFTLLRKSSSSSSSSPPT
jgi:hypothetical protein